MPTTMNELVVILMIEVFRALEKARPEEEPSRHLVTVIAGEIAAAMVHHGLVTIEEAAP